MDKQLAPFCQLATQVISNQQIGVPATNIAMDNPHPFSSIYHQNSVDVSLLCEFTGNYTITSGGDFSCLTCLILQSTKSVPLHHQLGKSPRPMLLEMCKNRIKSDQIQKKIFWYINGLYVGCRLVMLIINKSHFKHIQKDPK